MKSVGHGGAAASASAQAKYLTLTKALRGPKQNRNKAAVHPPPPLYLTALFRQLLTPNSSSNSLSAALEPVTRRRRRRRDEEEMKRCCRADSRQTKWEKWWARQSLSSYKWLGGEGGYGKGKGERLEFDIVLLWEKWKKTDALKRFLLQIDSRLHKNRFV